VHGFNHVQLAGYPWKIQNSEITQAVNVYRNFFGKEPLGWRSPYLSFDDNTFHILALRNFKWDSSYKRSRITWLRRLQSPIKLIPIDTRTLEKPYGTLMIHCWEINEETIKTAQSLKNKLVTHSQLFNGRKGK
jgi:peptidoglycan/xylan/chitin deacetylase (PgdA/CDA1 family)